MLDTPAPGDVPDRHAEPGLHWQDGFSFTSADDAFELRILGIVQGDFRAYFNGGTPDNYDSFLLRRARLYVEGTVMKYVDFRLMTDFGQGRAELLDGFGNVRLFDGALQLRIGKFKQPFSAEQFVMEDLTLVVFERSLLDSLAPARNVGAMLHGRNVGGVFDYALAVANGLRDSDFDAPRNDKDVLGRIAVRPFGRWENAPTPLKLLQLGVSASYGQEKGDVDAASFSTPLRVRFFEFAAGTRASGARTRVSPELQTFWGPVGFSAQVAQQWEQLTTTTGVTGQAQVQAFYALVTWVLTGESRTSYAQFIRPNKPFDFGHPLAGPGAFELTLRASGLRVIGAPVGSYDTATVSRSAVEFSVGLNWYLTRFVWLMVNYEHTEFQSHLRASNAASLRTTVMW